MIEILNFLKEQKLLNDTIKDYTSLTNEEMVSQGVLILVPFRGKLAKIVLPAPYHEKLFSDDNRPTYKQILTHEHAMLLK